MQMGVFCRVMFAEISVLDCIRVDLAFASHEEHVQVSHPHCLVVEQRGKPVCNNPRLEVCNGGIQLVPLSG